MRWEFKQEPGEKLHWRWQYVEAGTGTVLKLSCVLFGTLYECVKDAEMNGYVAVASSTTPYSATLHDLRAGN